MMPSIHEHSLNPCTICKEIPASVYAYLDRDDELPPAAKQLRAVGEHFRQCPQCGTYYYYDYWPPGPGNIGDREDLDRLTPEEDACLRPILEANNAAHLADDLAWAFASEQEQIRKWAKDAYEYVVRQFSFQAILPILTALIAHSNAQVRQFASAALAEQARDHDLTGAVTALQRALTDSDPIDLRAAEALTFQWLRDNKTDDLHVLLRSQHAAVRLGVLYALKIAAYRKTVPAEFVADVTRLLADKQEAHRASAAYVLNDLAVYANVDVAIPALSKALFDTARVREWAYKALNTAAWKQHDLRPVLPFLQRVLTERKEEERLEAARVLQRMMTSDLTPVLPALIENLRSSSILWPYDRLREAVADVLQKFAEQRTVNAQTLRALLKQAKIKGDTNREVQALCKALRRLTRKNPEA